MTWPEQRLGRIARLRVSNVDKLTRDGEHPVRLCNYVDVYKNSAVTGDLDFMEATATTAQISAFRLTAGDTVFTKDSETADDIGVPAYVAETSDDLVCGYHLAIATPDRSVVDPRFLFWAMSSTRLREQWTVLASGVTRVGLRSDDMTKASVPVPPLEEQRRIADFLDTETDRLDQLSAAFRRQTAATNCHLHAIVRSRTWFDVEVTPHPLRRYITRMKTGSTPASDGPDYSATEEGMNWLAPGSILDRLEVGEPARRLDPAAVRDRAVPRFEADSVIVVGIGATAGRVAYLPAAASGNQQLTAISTGPHLRPRFLAWQLWARSDELRALAPFTTLPILSNDYLRSVAVKVPSLEEQRRAVAHVDAESERVAGLGALWKRADLLLAERRQALVTAAVTGRLDVTTARGGDK